MPDTITGDDFVRAASRQIGKPYVWAGDTPAKGFDCSGLVEYTATNLGLRNVPRTSEAQYAWTQRVQPSDLQAGDLVFMNFPGESSPGHVMIYAGGGHVIQAPAPGQLVQEDAFNPRKPSAAEWGGTIVGYGRIPGVSYSGEPTGSASTPVVLGGTPVPRGRSRPNQAPTGTRGPVGESSSGGGSGGGGILGFFDDAGQDIGSAAGWVATETGGAATGAASSVWNDVTAAILGPLDFLRAALWLVNPLNWLRAFEAVVGIGLVVLAVLIAVRADETVAEATKGTPVGAAVAAVE